jgi:outer membrane protein assembly factor BamA
MIYGKVTPYGFLLLLAVLVLGSCSNTRFLTGDQLLYTGKKEVIISSGKFNNPKARQTIESVTSFKPNNALAGKRVLPPGGLWIYHYWKPDTGRKQPGWFFRTFSTEPVLVSAVNPEARSQKLESELFSKGFFRARVWASIDTSRRNPRKAGITYYIEPDQPFRYQTISFAPPVDAVDSLINGFQEELVLKPQDVFDLTTIKSETRKIAALLQEEGYFYFNPGHVKWTADTTPTPYQIDLRIGKNTDISENAGRKYAIDEVTVRITGDTDAPDDEQPADTILYNGIRIISTHEVLKPPVIARAVYFKKGDWYSVAKQQQTIQHLNSYGIFKYLNLQFMRDPDSLKNQLDLLLDMTTMKDINLDLEANVVTKSTGFSGPGFVATLAHGNLARGANKLQLKLNGGFEWQWGNNASSSLGTLSYNVGLSSSIILPKMLKPFRLFNTSRFTLPQTSMTLGVEFLNKIQYYRMSSINLGLAYQWKRSQQITHIYYPLFFNSITLLETTPEFDSILTANPYIRKSFEEQFIAGMKYDFIFDNNLTKPPHGFYFQAGIGTSGNLIDLVKRATSGEAERPYSVLGNVYSQFLKFSTDIRYYRNIRDHSIAFRLYAGLGIPYSNSVVMPYVEQFYSGGSNSIRAFVARSVGPGSLPPDETSDIIDQTGDIRLEGNLEYRFRLSKVLHGALFLDAGNVWLLNPDETRPGAEFHFNTFTDQLAVGTGIGFRFDFNFFILRTDFGIPMRRPYATDDSNWIGSITEMWDDMVFNLAIGYPF